MTDLPQAANEPDDQQWLHLRQVLDAFEDAWQRGQPPRIADYLPADAGQRQLLLPELVQVDLELRFKAGMAVQVESYLQQYPELGRDQERVLQLVLAEFELQREKQGNLTPGPYFQRFPQFSAELRKRLSDLPSDRETLPYRQAGPGAPAQPTNQPAPRADPDSPPEATLPGSPVASAVVPLPPISGYEVLDILGQGGMGIVYKARDRKLDRLVALKMVRTDSVPTSGQLARFQIEARAAARLKHPNIVQIYEVGQDRDVPYLTLEYIEGSSLASKIQGQPWQPRAAARLVATLARAVQHAHDQGVLHRDLKPANVLLDAQGQPHLTDFGLARWLQPAGPGNTLSGDLLGSPPYMPPEQAAGRTEQIGPASDIFGLGAILYELLTGRAPYSGKDLNEVRLQAIQARFLPPRQLNPKVPRVLERTCLKALAASPTDRYPSAAALADELDHFVTWPRRRGLLVGAVLLLVVVLLSGLALLPSRKKAEVKPLTGELIVELCLPQEGSRRRRVEEVGALPALPGEWAHIEARVSEPAYVYLLWLDSQGNVVPLYPWNLDKVKLDLTSPPPPQQPQVVVQSPIDPNGEEDRGWRLDKHEGLETVLLLARRTPLPDPIQLATVIGDRLPPTTYHSPQEVVLRGFDSAGIEQVKMSRHRGFDREAEGRDNPMLGLMNRLRDQAGFEVVRAVRFAHKGDD
jgi:serine/threonine protein kinase